MPYVNLIFPKRFLYRYTICKRFSIGEAEEIVQASCGASLMLVATKIIHKILIVSTAKFNDSFEYQEYFHLN